MASLNKGVTSLMSSQMPMARIKPKGKIARPTASSLGKAENKPEKQTNAIIGPPRREICLLLGSCVHLAHQ